MSHVNKLKCLTHEDLPEGPDNHEEVAANDDPEDAGNCGADLEVDELLDDLDDGEADADGGDDVPGHQETRPALEEHVQPVQMPDKYQTNVRHL